MVDDLRKLVHENLKCVIKFRKLVDEGRRPSDKVRGLGIKDSGIGDESRNLLDGRPHFVMTHLRGENVGPCEVGRYNFWTIMSVPLASPELRTEDILGLPVALVDLDQAVAKILGFLEQDGPNLILTANAIAAVMVHDESATAEVLKQAALVTADGAGVQWAVRKRTGVRVPKVTGVDILDRLCAVSADRGTRLFFLGGAPGVAEEAAERIRLKYPGCNIVGTRHGFFPASDDDVIAAEVGAAKPDILFVAMGMPRQERFYLNTFSHTGAKVGIGVGGSFDVFSGRVKRAPVLWQKLHLEWLWRAILNPKKISNLRHLPRFVWLMMRTK